MIDNEPPNMNAISKIIPVIVFDDVQKTCVGNTILKVDIWHDAYGVK